MSIVLASAARASTGARSGQEDAFQLWPADGVARPEGESGGLLAVLADGMGGHTGGAVAGQTACSTFAEVFAAAASPYDQRLQIGTASQQRSAGQGRRGELGPARHGLHDRCRLDGHARHPLGERRRLASAALPLSRCHPPQCRPFAGLVPGRAGATEPDLGQRSQATPEPQCLALGAHRLENRSHRSAQRAVGAARRRLDIDRQRRHLLARRR